MKKCKNRNWALEIWTPEKKAQLKVQKHKAKEKRQRKSGKAQPFRLKCQAKTLGAKAEAEMRETCIQQDTPTRTIVMKRHAKEGMQK